MTESFVYLLAPELKGVDPQRVWDSEVTAGYPKNFRLGDVPLELSGQVEAHEALGKYLKKLDLIPEAEAILDLGAGPCSDLVFGRQVVKDRVWGIDYAEGQLGRSQIPANRQTVADLRKNDFAAKLGKNHFALATSFLLAKYLTVGEAGSLYGRIRNIAQRLVVVEYRAVAEEFEELLGQKRTFVLEEEKMLLETTGWQNAAAKILKVNVGNDSHVFGIVWAEADR